MTQQEQAQIVSKAYQLEKKQKDELDKLERIQNDRFMSPPAKPERQIVPPVKYPLPDPKIKFNWITFFVMFGIVMIPLLAFKISGTLGTILLFLFWIGGPIVAIKLAQSHKLSVDVCGYFTGTWLGYVVYYKVMKSFLTEEVRNSEDYKKLCLSMDEQSKKTQEELDKKYEQEMDYYNNEIIPQYEKEKIAWEENHNKELTEQTSVYEGIVSELEEYYSSTRIIPQQYHNIVSLEYLDSIMSSSEYDIAAAIESYEKKMSRDLEMQRIREQQIANEKAEEQNALLYQQNEQLQRQNELQEESNNIAERTRRDQNRAAIVGAVQNHNRNKYLKDISNRR